MLKNYFKIAFKNLARNKAYGLVNITGLAVGLASFIIILLYLNYEFSYDTWSASLKRVYKVSEQTDKDILTQTSVMLGGLLQDNSPVIEAATTMQPAGDFPVLVSGGGKKIYQPGSVMADSSFFKVFSYQFIVGNAATALDKPNAVVLSENVARKIFGTTDVVGKTIKVFNAFDFEITGVMQLPETPSHLNVQFVCRDIFQKQGMFWENYSYLTYIKLNQSMSDEKLEEHLNGIFYDNHLKKDNQSLENFRKSGHQAGLFVDELRNIHNFPKHGNSNITTVAVLLLLAALLLIAGAINFSNLSIAASVKRAKEVGVRKVLGSSKRQLLVQFVGEVAMQCLISLVVAIFLVRLALPYFNNAMNTQIRFFQFEGSAKIIGQIGLCLLIVTMLSSLYPAIFLSRYNITKVLKGDYTMGKKGVVLRNVLIVVQFTVSAFFVISALILSRQINYMQTKDKGFSGEQVIRIQSQQPTREANFESVKATLLSIPGVQYVCKTTKVPGDARLDTSTVSYKFNGNEYRMASVKVSADYFKTLNIERVQGRLFDNGYADQHTRTAVINEAAAVSMNLQNPIGATITFPDCDSVPVQIVGVVRNTHISGFEKAVVPEVFTIGNDACMFQSGGAVLIKLSSSNMKQAVAAIETAWKKIEPDFPIQYSFLDENFQKLFTSYIHLQQVIIFFGLVAIIISVIGLFALTAFLIGRRTKEIGIRKTLGAGTGNISLLLGKDFLRLVGIAVLIAIPAGWWAATKWLQAFAYHITLSGWIFFTAALMVVITAVIIIGTQTIRAAIANPVKSLRTE